MAYFDPVGYYSLNQKERITVERKIKQLLKDRNDDVENINNNRNSQNNSIQTSCSSSLELSQVSRSTSKSTFASFISSISTSTTRRYSTCNFTNRKSSIADEFLLYKTLANKEVETIIETKSDPDASQFW